MVHAENMFAIQVKKPVRLQVQGQAHMGAGVFIGENFITLPLDKNFKQPCPLFIGKGFCLAVGDVVQPAQYIPCIRAVREAREGNGIGPRVRLFGLRGLVVLVGQFAKK